MRSSLAALVRRAPDRRETALRFAAVAAGAAIVASSALPAAAQCILVRERGGLLYAPHFVLHFGDASAVPRHLQSSTALDKDLPTFFVPIYAYNLWEGAQAFELSLRTPVAPLGFDRGPDITSVDLNVTLQSDGAVTSLHLEAGAPLCGPVYLGSLRLPAASLPTTFRVALGRSLASDRCAARTADGAWRAAAADDGGARIAPGTLTTLGACGLEAPVQALRAVPGERTGLIDLSWTSGSGNFTLLRYRTDGRYPTDPWDGELLAFLPASVTHLADSFEVPGTMRIAAWSITRGPFGNYYTASNVECGSLASITVQLPVGVTARGWGQVKSLFR